MNKLQQEVRRFEEKMCYEQKFGASLCNTKTLFLGLCLAIINCTMTHSMTSNKDFDFEVVVQKLQTKFSKLFQEV
jgi:hypothetical protein